MTAHVLFENIDHNVPTFSSYWITTVLRDEFQFSGVVFSDDLTMHGAAGGGDITARALKSLQAGCDMALICNDPASARVVADNIGTLYPADQSRLEAMRGTSPADSNTANLSKIADTLGDALIC